MKKIAAWIARNPFSASMWIMAFFFAASSAFTIGAYARRKSLRNCSSFSTYADAQAYYQADPKDHGYLDRNHDGTACEWLKHRK